MVTLLLFARVRNLVCESSRKSAKRLHEQRGRFARVAPPIDSLCIFFSLSEKKFKRVNRNSTNKRN
jgi:hypothetical protein